MQFINHQILDLEGEFLLCHGKNPPVLANSVARIPFLTSASSNFLRSFFCTMEMINFIETPPLLFYAIRNFSHFSSFFFIFFLFLFLTFKSVTFLL